MKAVLITYNQSLTEEIQEILDNQSIRGYTQWTETFGRGSFKGDMHEGTHTWPEMNNVHLTIVEDEKVDDLLHDLQALNNKVEEQGLRAFVWNVEKTI